MSAVNPPHPDPQVDASTPPLAAGWRGPAWAFHVHPARQVEAEVDFGYDWSWDGTPDAHRVSWNPTTGELYAEALGGVVAGVTVLATTIPARALVDALVGQYPYPGQEGRRSLDGLAATARAIYGTGE